MNTCQNCNNEFTGRYCNQCGQKLIKGKLQIRDVFSEALQSIFYVDSPFLKTFLLALVKPGKLSSNYITGHRQSYIKPIQFFLLFLTIYYIVLGYFGAEMMENVQTSFVSAEGTEAYNLAKARIDEMNRFFQQNVNLLYFGYVPIFALFSLAFLRKSGFNFAESLVFGLYTLSIDLLFTSIITILTNYTDLAYFLRFPIMFIYFPAAVMQLSGKFNVGTYLRGFLIYFLTTVSYLFITGIVLFIVYFIIYS